MSDLTLICWTYSLAAALLIAILAMVILRNIDKERDNIVITITLFGLSILCMIRSITLILGLNSSDVTSLNIVLTGLCQTILLSLYPLRAMFPEFFKDWRLSMLFFPLYTILLAIYITYIAGVSYPPFNIIESLRNGEGLQLNIIIRYNALLTTLIYAITPAALAIYRKQNLKVRIYSYANIVSGVIIILFFILPQHFHAIIISYITWICLFSISITYIASKDWGKKQQPEKVIPDAIVAENNLWQTIEQIMKEDEPWRDPHLRLENLAIRVNSNRTTVSALIHSKSGCSFNEYVANYRIAAFCNFVDNQYVENTSSLLFEVGFQSQSSALKHFRRIHNTTPSRYIKTVSNTTNTTPPEKALVAKRLAPKKK